MQILELLCGYNYWANRRLMDTAAALPASDLFVPGNAGTASLLDTLVHILFAEWVWRMRLQDGISPGKITPWEALDIPNPVEDPQASFKALKARWMEEERAMRAFLSGLKEEDLTRNVQFRTMSGVAHEAPLWPLLYHLLNHGTQHRSEAALWLTELGHSLGDLDYIVYMREKPGE